eukprot:PhF_6_TR29403/c0_g1_i1/m.43411
MKSVFLLTRAIAITALFAFILYRILLSPPSPSSIVLTMDPDEKVPHNDGGNTKTDGQVYSNSYSYFQSRPIGNDNCPTIRALAKALLALPGDIQLLLGI